MDLLKKENLVELSDTNHEFSVSMYLPTHRTGEEMQQDPIRLKNLLSAAEKELESRGMDAEEQKKMLRPAYEMLEDSELWQHMSDGLAIFMHPGSFQFYREPLQFEDMLMISSTYYLKPLLPQLSGNGDFYILALSQNDIRLMHATRSTVDIIEVHDMPEDIDEMLAIEVHHQGQQFHSGTPSGRQGRAAIFHGHGDQEDSKDQIERYFRKIDKAVCEVLQDQNAPMVLAGVDYLHAIYHKVNNYPKVMEEGVIGNPDHNSADYLHEQSWEIMKPYFTESQTQATEKFKQFNGTGKATDKMHDIWSAATQGKIETLFIDRKAHEWGKANGMGFEIHAERKPDSTELLDFVCMETLKNGGVVFAVDAEEMPINDKIAAVYRY